MSRAPIILDVDGERKTYAEWSAWAKATLGIDLSASVIRARMKTGNWMPRLAVTPAHASGRYALSAASGSGVFRRVSQWAKTHGTIMCSSRQNFTGSIVSPAWTAQRPTNTLIPTSSTPSAFNSFASVSGGHNG